MVCHILHLSSKVGYKGPPIETTAVSQLIKDEESCPTGVEGAVIGLGNAETEVDAVDGLTSKGVAGGEAAMTSEDIGESESGCAAVTAADVHDSTHPLSQAVVGEPFHKYLVGFGRNPFGRFSLTAALNEKTGRHHLLLLPSYSCSIINQMIKLTESNPLHFTMLIYLGRMRCEKKYITSKGTSV